MMRMLLGERDPSSGHLRARKTQKTLWQVPAMLLNGSLYLFVAGLCVLFYYNIQKHMKDLPQPLPVSFQPFMELVAIDERIA
jgi:ABC-type multidrug transport system permease subunit